ncbi:hypothetical protein YB2330_006045 [Saitoella coloradoensis]
MYHRKRPRSPERDPANPYIHVGTPLPPDPSTRDDGSYVPVWQQEARDERGRKRFHGAFTGGFSAGYFNTVGSKEGWTPSTFKSSRTERAKTTQRVEDFMDDEDLADLREAQGVSTKESFSGIGTEAELASRGLFDDIFAPKTESIGTKLLKKMGWREGTGIGPRVTKAEEEAPVGKTFAPKNTTLITFDKKAGTQGLGYAASPGLVVPPPPPPVKKSSSKPERHSGFGVGVLNELDGEEDEDPYTIIPKTRYDRVLGGEKKKAAALKASGAVSAAARHAFIPKGKKVATANATSSRRCHDSLPPLPGFVLVETPFMNEKMFPPPSIPEGWEPKSVVRTANMPTLPLPTAAAGQQLSARDRGALLGEAPLPGKSVFDFLTPEARARLVNVTGKTDLPQAMSEKQASALPWTPGHAVAKPTVDAETALQALKGNFMPYAEDLAKQSRYRAWLEWCAKMRPEIPPDCATREIDEFTRVAIVFRPVSGMMAKRFTSSTSSALSAETSENTEVLRQGGPVEKKVDTAEEAAKVGMYGMMTRKVEDWYPMRLLCKRFDVKDPHPGGPSAVPPKQAPDLVDKASVDRMLMDMPRQQREAVEEKQREDQARRQAEAEEKRKAEEARELPSDSNKALEAERPAMDVFASIFGDDDDDD